MIETAATPKRIVKVLRVVDTRELIEDGDRFVRVSGSGESHECDRCGRPHEVHVWVTLDDESVAVVGTGCMKLDEIVQRREADRMLAKLRTDSVRAAEKARDDRRQAFLAQAWQALLATEPPAATIEGGEKTYSTGRPRRWLRVDVGDAREWLWDADAENPDAIERAKRIAARGWRVLQLDAAIVREFGDEPGFACPHGPSPDGTFELFGRSAAPRGRS